MKQPTKKSVSFQAYANVRLTIGLHDFTEDEVEAYWYSDEERESIRDEIKQTLKMTKQNRLRHDDPNYCLRGLESCTGKARDLKESARFRARESVLFEQDKQEYKSSIMPPFCGDDGAAPPLTPCGRGDAADKLAQTIADVYAKKCIQSCSLGQLKGILDQETVRMMYNIDEQAADHWEETSSRTTCSSSSSTTTSTTSSSSVEGTADHRHKGCLRSKNQSREKKGGTKSRETPTSNNHKKISLDVLVRGLRLVSMRRRRKRAVQKKVLIPSAA